MIGDAIDLTPCFTMADGCAQHPGWRAITGVSQQIRAAFFNIDMFLEFDEKKEIRFIFALELPYPVARYRPRYRLSDWYLAGLGAAQGRPGAAFQLHS